MNRKDTEKTRISPQKVRIMKTKLTQYDVLMNDQSLAQCGMNAVDHIMCSKRFLRDFQDGFERA